MHIIWDLFHFGYPDGLDPFSTDFVRRFTAFARAFMHLLKNETDTIPFVTPINEIPFLPFKAAK